MAKRIARIYGGAPMITEYDFDNEQTLKKLNTRLFSHPTEAWATFVINNRSREYSDFSSLECNHNLKYDIVIGPIANDDLALLFRSLERGLMTMETLAREMEYKTLTDQYSFHTERAIAFLTKAGVHNV